ncbi:hypothetical protein [Clostridium estertheticum]|nr:hypothetical protein [Clostridium estertheticum]
MYLVIENKRFYYDVTYEFTEISDLGEVPDEKSCSELEKMNVELI